MTLRLKIVRLRYTVEIVFRLKRKVILGLGCYQHPNPFTHYSADYITPKFFRFLGRNEFTVAPERGRRSRRPPKPCATRGAAGCVRHWASEIWRGG